MRPEQEGKATLQSMHLGAAAAPVMDAAVSTITLLLVLSPVPTVIATKTNLEVEVSHKGAEAVADAEEDLEIQGEVEEDSKERTFRREEEEQEGLLPEGDSATTTTRNSGVNGIGGEDEQYDKYCDKLQGYDDTPSLNNVNGELDQENY
jgi:hypothetical protein